MGRPKKGAEKLVPAPAYISKEMDREINAAAHEHGPTDLAPFRRLLIEEGWALYKRLGRDKFMAERKHRLSGVQHGKKKAAPSGS